ncbi:MAG TPA: FAD:protein FMN transferase [Gammaproteobacteria bacterium]|nr:FAD:protein FMN transferase [Gammaproteobacteria bacterium]
MPGKGLSLEALDGYWAGRFRAMASPCEVLTDAADEATARALLEVVAAEAARIETKLSRYVAANIVDRINTADGAPVEVDAETAQLIDFADQIFRLSEGAFDITSGVLRKAWTFDGGSEVPEPGVVEALLELVGWEKVSWRSPVLTLQPGMQIDFGGIGKEYAVDRAAALAAARSGASCLVNFGGDLVVTHPRRDGKSWKVGIEATDAAGCASRMILLSRGGLATSGDTKRYVVRDGVRYGHILDARTGWPVRDAVHSVTVAADTCTEAGMLATLAMLQGAGAEAFLDAQGVQYWCSR